MPRYALLALACLAGCASHDPQRIVDGGGKYEFSTGLAPRRLAQCTAINASTMPGPYTSEVHQLVRPDNYAVLVKRTEWVGETFIVARTWPEPGGSRLELFMSADLGRASEADWIARLRKGCDAVRAVSVIRPVEIRTVPTPEAPPPVQRPRPTRG
jgi:hypothetical protein